MFVCKSDTPQVRPHVSLNTRALSAGNVAEHEFCLYNTHKVISCSLSSTRSNFFTSPDD